MNDDAILPNRRSIRLPYYDYSSAGAYFVTICTRERHEVLGHIHANECVLNKCGMIALDALQSLPLRYSYLQLDEFVIMPNHVHVVLPINYNGAGGSRTAPTADKRKILGRVVGVFKTASTKRINVLCGAPGAVLWQRNYYEHVIRNDDDLRRIREYIVNNPLQWALDKENPDYITPSK